MAYYGSSTGYPEVSLPHNALSYTATQELQSTQGYSVPHSSLPLSLSTSTTIQPLNVPCPPLASSLGSAPSEHVSSCSASNQSLPTVLSGSSGCGAPLVAPSAHVVLPHVYNYASHIAGATVAAAPSLIPRPSTVDTFLPPHPAVAALGVIAPTAVTSQANVVAPGPLPGRSSSTASGSLVTPTLNVPRQKTHLRKAAGEVWNDPSLDEWDPNSFRVFCGDLGNEVTDELLSNAFRHYKSFQRAKVVRDKRTGKGRGYGFVAFQDPHDLLRALKEMDRKYVGNRPIRVMKSRWKEREIGSAQTKRLNDNEITAPNASKTLKKFKVIKGSSGGKRAATAPVAASSNPVGYHGIGPSTHGAGSGRGYRHN